MDLAFCTGVIPDVEVLLTADQEAAFYDFTVDTDPQIVKAFETAASLLNAGQSAEGETAVISGGIGVTGGQAANVIAREADVVLAVGTRLTDFTTCSTAGSVEQSFRMRNSKSVNVCERMLSIASRRCCIKCRFPHH